MKTFKPPFRVGKKQGRAVLDSNGHEVVVFSKGCEYMANDYVTLINEDLYGYDGDASARDIAKKYKAAVGRIGCPHCGIVTLGVIQSANCDWCGNDRFKIDELKHE